MKATEEKYNNIGSDAVKAKTQKGWSEWFKILDKEKANKLSHKEIAALLYNKYKVPGWWGQMITVGYEQARGLRVKNQRGEKDFSVDISKVMAASLSALYQSVEEEALRKKWLKGKVEIRKASKDKSIRANFNKETANLTFMFYSKGKNKAQLVITESKLENAKITEERRTFWKAALAKLEQVLTAR